MPLAFEGGKSAAQKVVWPLPQDVDHLLKVVAVSLVTTSRTGRDSEISSGAAAAVGDTPYLVAHSVHARSGVIIPTGVE